MMDAFIESGMTFGPFNDSQIFRIEKSKMLKRCNGIKSVEFIYQKKKHVLMFVEAKSSSPVKHSGNMNEYDMFLEEITQKFMDSFHLYMAGLLKRKSGYEEINDALMKANYQKMKFVFILIINGHEKTWLAPLVEDLRGKIKSFLAIWNSDIVVMNDEIAREETLIT